MSWFRGETSGEVLSKAGKARALPFAQMSLDVYAPNASAQMGGASHIDSWTDILRDDRNVAGRLSGMDRAEVRLGRFLGFNASLYKLAGLYDQVKVIAFEGTQSVGSALFADVSATLDFVNKLGEPVVDALLKKLLKRTAFTKALNARGAPSTAYDLADLLAREAKLLHGPDIVLTGHSLGGGMAQYAANLNGLRAIGFNSAGAGVTIPGQDAGELIVRVDTKGYLGLSKLFNKLVTDGSDIGSFHFGSRYYAGKGGHGIADVISALEKD